LASGRASNLALVFLRNIVRATSFSRARVNALEKRARLDLAGIVASGPSPDNVDLADRSLARLKGDECSDLPGRMNSGVVFVLSAGSRSLSQRGRCDRFPSPMFSVAGSAFLSPSFLLRSFILISLSLALLSVFDHL